MRFRALPRCAGRPSGERALRLLSSTGLLLASATAARAQPPAQPALADFLAALSRPAVVGEADLGTLKVGRAEIVPAAGSRWLVLAAAGRPCGVLLQGDATLTYRIEDRFSLPIARWNLKPMRGLEAREDGGSLVLVEPLKGAAIWGWDIAEPGPEPRPVAGARLPDWLIEVLERKFAGNPERDMALSARNGEPGYRWALLHATSDDLVLDVDPRPVAREEALTRLRRLGADARPYAGRLVQQEISAQPIGRSWWEPPTVTLASVDTEIAVDNDRGEHATVTTKTRLESLADGTSLLFLALAEEFVDDRGTPRRYELASLTVGGQPASWVRLGANLLVELPHPLKAHEQVELVATTAGDILDHPGGDSFWWLGSSSWYPRPAAGGTEWAAFRIRVATPPPFVPFTAGEVLERTHLPASNRVTTALKGPMESIHVLAGRYSTVTEENQGSRIHVSTYASVKEEEARRLARIAFAIRGCLEAWLAVPYPFQDLEMIEVNSWGWGQAPPGEIFITREAFMTPARARLDEETQVMTSVASRGINERVAHEVAHAWFPHIAKIVTSEENWLSESFADYASAVCLERTMADRGRARFLFDRQLKDWKYYTKEAEGLSVFLANHLSREEEGYQQRYYLLYGKGPLVLHALRRELARTLGGEKQGDQAFFTWMRAYVRNFTYKSGETRHLVGILNQMTGKDWQPWFERYVYGTETPELR